MTNNRRQEKRNQEIHRLGLCFFLSLCTVPHAALAAEKVEQWRATSTTSLAVTGDVTFMPDRIRFQNGTSLPLAPLGHVSDFKAMDEKVDAVVYRVTTPADPTLENTNRLCGSASHSVPVTYIAIWNSEALPGDASPRSMAAFSGKNAPRAATSTASCCGVYVYDSLH